VLARAGAVEWADEKQLTLVDRIKLASLGLTASTAIFAVLAAIFFAGTAYQ
jgi:hypothetical protein